MGRIKNLTENDRYKKLFDERSIHAAFEISLALKGAFSLAEIATGIFTYFVTRQFLFDLTNVVTRAELTEDPHDFIANHLLHGAQNLSVSSQHFTALYLLSHGIIKLWLIVGLWQKRTRYYPVAMAVFGMFIAYQLYRYSFTHSPLLILLTALDAVVITLTWYEYKYLRRIAPNAHRP